jgi:hypothetical protein
MPPPIRPVQGCPPSHWQLVSTSSGDKIIEDINPPSPLPSEVFPVIEVNSRDWNRLRRQELYVPKSNKSRPPIGGINGKGFGPRH